MTPASATTPFIHATVLVIGEAGVLIRGPSGAGKSGLALRLIAEAGLRGRFARLVGDDRVGLTAADGAVVARPHPAIAGRLERRGLPIASVPYEAGCVIRLVVELCEDPLPRLPNGEQEKASLLEGVSLPMLRLPSRTIELSCLFVLHELGLG